MREEETLPFLFLRSRSSAFQRDPPLCGGFDPSSAHYKGRGNSSLSFLGEAGRAILSEIRRPLADSIPAAPTIREEETLPFLFLESRSSASQRDPPSCGGFDPSSAHYKGRGNSSLSFFRKPIERITARSAVFSPRSQTQFGNVLTLKQSFCTLRSQSEIGNEEEGREVLADWRGLFALFVFLSPPIASIQRAVIFLCHGLPPVIISLINYESSHTPIPGRSSVVLFSFLVPSIPRDGPGDSRAPSCRMKGV